MLGLALFLILCVGVVALVSHCWGLEVGKRSPCPDGRVCRPTGTVGGAGLAGGKDGAGVGGDPKLKELFLILKGVAEVYFLFGVGRRGYVVT